LRILAIWLLIQQPAHAANRTWSNTATDFNNGASWGGTAPGVNDVAIFSNAMVTQPNLSASLATTQLKFSTTASSGYDITSSNTSIKLTLTSTGTTTSSVIYAANTSGTNTIDAPIILGAAAASTETFTQAAGGTLVINGIISSTNTVTLSLTGGIITLAGANTYSGGTALAASTTLRINNATALGTGTFTINGGTIDNTTAGSITLSNNNAQTWNGDFTFTGTQSLNMGTGAISLGTTAGTTRTITVNGSTLTEGGIISNGTTATSLTKAGTGILTLTGANAYTGATTVSAGVLNIQNATALGTIASGTTVSSGATLQLQGGITIGAEALTISGAGASGQNGALVNVSGTNNYAGLLTLGAATTISSDSGTLNLTHVGTITGATFGLTLTGSGSGSLTSILGTTSGTLTKSGSGTWTLSGINTFTGSTTVNGGTLTLSSAGAALVSTSSITVNSGGTLLLGASNQINNSAGMTLAGGTFAKGSFSEGTAIAVGIGALTLTAIGSHIDFGTGTVGVLSFASFTPGSFTIVIDNWTGIPDHVGDASTDRLIFDSDQSSNLSHFSFTGYAGAEEIALGGGFFEIVPVGAPEPSTYFAAALALLATVYHQRRRIRVQLVERLLRGL